MRKWHFVFCNDKAIIYRNPLPIISLLTFDPNHTDLEIWDSPLIHADEELLLFVPSLIDYGSPVRAVENCLAQWNPDLFAKRGKILEQEIKKSLQGIPGIKAQSPIAFKAFSLNRDVECDLVVTWDSQLIFIEAKCTKSIFSPADFYRGKQHIEYAIEQLHLRREMALQNWAAFRQAATELDLPPEPLPAEQIKLIVATNVLQFTGWQTNDVIVTDEFCVQRFFDDNPDVEAFMGNERIGTIARMRKSKTFKASEFFEYLKHPPQVEFVKAEIQIDISPLMVVQDSDTKIGVLHSSYKPSDKVVMLKTKSTSKPVKQRHRHRKKAVSE